MFRTVELTEENAFKRLPRKSGKSLFSGGLGVHIPWVGILLGIICLGIQACTFYTGNNNWQTMIFTVLSISQLGHAMAIRSDPKSLFRQGVFGNRQLVWDVLLTLGLQLAAIYVPFMQNMLGTQPLSIPELLICILLSSIVCRAVEIEKYCKRNRM